MNDNSPSKTRSGVSMWLAASLAVNAALIGIVGGGLIAKKETVEQAESEKDPDRRPSFRHAFKDMDEGRREAMRKAFFKVWKDSKQERATLGEALAELRAATAAEPFDRQRVEESIVSMLSAEQSMRRAGLDAILDFMETSSVEEREVILKQMFRGPGRRNDMKRGKPKGERGQRGDRPPPPREGVEDASRPEGPPPPEEPPIEPVED